MTSSPVLSRAVLLALCVAVGGFTHIRTEDRAGAPFLRWSKGFQVPIHVHGAGYSRIAIAEVRAALEGSLATWNAVDGADLTFIRDPAGRDGDTPDLDGFNTIRFEERALPPEIDPDSVLAWTSPLSVACTGILIEADITFNAVSFRWTVNGRGNDIESIALHEVGHLLGLDHSRDRDAVMFPSVQEDVRRDLHPDDIAGVRAIYPPARGLACSRDGDCGGGEVCLYSLRSDEVLDSFCGLSLGGTRPGGRCNADLGPCDSGCANGLCFEDNVCSAVCAADGDCPAGWSCIGQGGGDGLCIDVDRCADNGDCAAGEVCGLTLDGDDELLQLCITAGDSPDGRPCQSGGDCAGGICLDSCTRLCTGPADCEAGLVCAPVEIPLGGGRSDTVSLCTLMEQACAWDGQCPEGLACAYVAVDGALENRCAPATGRAVGGACRQDAECRSGICEDRRCGAVCRNDGHCPDNMECGRVQRGAQSLSACLLIPGADVGVEPERDAAVEPERDAAVEPERDAAVADARPARDAAPLDPDRGRVPDADPLRIVDAGAVLVRANPEEGCAAAPGRSARWPLFFLPALVFLRRPKRTA